jgi:hypothetical protein
MASRRVGSSDTPVVPPNLTGGGPAIPPDPQTVGEAVQDRYLGTDPRDVGKIETPRVTARNFSDLSDPKFARLAAEVLVRATVLAMAQIDEPNAGEGQPPSQGKRNV